MLLAVVAVIALLVGFIAGHVVALVLKHDIITDAIVKAGATYKELVIRGDAAMSMLHHAVKELESFGSGKRVVLAEDLTKLKTKLGIVHDGVIVKPDGS